MQPQERAFERERSKGWQAKAVEALGSVRMEETLRTAGGSFLGISLVAWLTYYFKIPLLAPSFGATAVLIYAACHVPMAQPRNVIGGHLISAALGVATFQLFGLAWWPLLLIIWGKKGVIPPLSVCAGGRGSQIVSSSYSSVV